MLANCSRGRGRTEEETETKYVRRALRRPSWVGEEYVEGGWEGSGKVPLQFELGDPTGRLQLRCVSYFRVLYGVIRRLCSWEMSRQVGKMRKAELVERRLSVFQG